MMGFPVPTRDQLAEAVLHNQLRDGPRRTREVAQAAHFADVPKRDLRAARRKLGVRAFRVGDGWWWVM